MIINVCATLVLTQSNDLMCVLLASVLLLLLSLLFLPVSTAAYALAVHCCCILLYLKRSPIEIIRRKRFGITYLLN